MLNSEWNHVNTATAQNSLLFSNRRHLDAAPVLTPFNKLTVTVGNIIKAQYGLITHNTCNLIQNYKTKPTACGRTPVNFLHRAQMYKQKCKEDIDHLELSQGLALTLTLSINPLLIFNTKSLQDVSHMWLHHSYSLSMSGFLWKKALEETELRDGTWRCWGC